MPFFQYVGNKQGEHLKIPRFVFSVSILANGKYAVWLSPRSMQDTPCTAHLLACCLAHTAAAAESMGIHMSLFQLIVLLWWLSFSLAFPSSKLLCMVAPIVWAFNHHLREIYFVLLFNVKEGWWASFHRDISVEGANWMAHSEIPEEKKKKKDVSEG